MKIRMLKDVLVEIEKPKLEEVWDKQLRKWDELKVDTLHEFVGFGYVSAITYDGDIYRLPSGTFEVLS